MTAEELAAELALMRRRLARSESARTQAEALLEIKSRVLAQANEQLKAKRERLRIELGQRMRQLLEAQRVAGFGTMIWDAEAFKAELSPYCQALLGLQGLAEIDGAKSVDGPHPMLDRVVPEERQKVYEWSERLTARALELKRSGVFSPPRRREPDLQHRGLRELRASGPIATVCWSFASPARVTAKPTA